MTADVLAGHAVVMGDSRFASRLARQAAATGPVVHAGAEPLSGESSPGGAIREIQPLRDPETLLAEAAAARARLVVIDVAEDAAAIGLLAALAAMPGESRPEIVAHIRDPGLRRAVDDNLVAAGLAPRPHLVSTASLAAERAVAAMRPWSLAEERGQTRVHAVVLGFSTLGRACFEDLLVAGIAGEFGKPLLTVLDRDPDAVRGLIQRDMPEIEVSAEIRIAAYDPLTLTAPDGPLAAAAAAAPITLICIALEDQSAALSAMTAIARLQEQDGDAVAAGLVVTEGHTATLDLAKPAGRPRDPARSWSVFGGIDQDADILDLVTRRADLLAERIHDVYCAEFGGAGAASQPWPRLRETYRRANRRAAAHLPVKLWTLGLREPGRSADPFAVDPHSYENVIKPCAASASEDALLRRLSRIEHDRWCAERRLDGWRFGDVRDDSRRIHPKLVPFDDPRFTDLDIEKDAGQVRFLFGHVVTPAPDGAVSPLVIGIAAQAGASGGIAVPAALSLCSKEPWRPIVVVSALLDGTECRLLAHLAAELDRANQTWRLLVPEISRDNRELRVVTGPGEEALLASFLGRPSTRFAAIGGALAPADLWADPSAPDPHAERILAYITARASAIVAGAEPASAPLADAAG